MNDSWISLRFKPGLGPTRHSILIQISRTGLLKHQALRHSGGDSNETAFQLTDEQLQQVKAVSQNVDFESLESRLRGLQILDASILTICINDSEGGKKEVSGPIFAADKGYHDFRTVWEPAQRLWMLVESMIP